MYIYIYIYIEREREIETLCAILNDVINDGKKSSPVKTDLSFFMMDTTTKNQNYFSGGSNHTSAVPKFCRTCSGSSDNKLSPLQQSAESYDVI